MAALQQRFHAWLSDSADETVLRWIFRSIVAVTVVVLGVDLVGMNGWLIFPDAAAPAEPPHDRLFVFTPDEMKSLNLATTAAAAAPVAISILSAPAKGRS
jgi:hypothetical protein